MKPSMSNLSISIPCYLEWAWSDTIFAGWFFETTLVSGIIFFKNDISKRLCSLCSPHNRIIKSPPARIASAMTTAAQLLTASILLNRLFVLCLLLAARGFLKDCARSTASMSLQTFSDDRIQTVYREHDRCSWNSVFRYRFSDLCSPFEIQNGSRFATIFFVILYL